MTRVLALLASAMLAATCSQPTPPAPPPALDGGPATCTSVCAHWAALGCGVAAKADRCIAACTAVQTHPEFTSWDLECRARVTSCDQIERCQ